MQYSCSNIFFSLSSPPLILVYIGNKRNSVIRKSLSGGLFAHEVALFLAILSLIDVQTTWQNTASSIWRTQSWLEYRLSGSPIKSGMLLHRETHKLWKWMATAILCRWNICLNHLKIKFDRNSFGNCGAVCVYASTYIFLSWLSSL